MRKAIKDFAEQREQSTIEEYQALLDILFSENQPVSAAEADILMKMFPEDSHQELEYSLIQAIETVQLSRAQFKELLEKAPSESLKEKMLEQFKRYKK